MLRVTDPDPESGQPGVESQEPSQKDPVSGGASHRLRDWSTIIAILGLLVTMVFNTIGVWQQVDQSERQAEQARETRLYTQVGLLVQLNQFAAQMDRELNATQAGKLRCEPDPLFRLNARDSNSLYAALDFYDEVAWLFNQDVVTLRAARRHWSPSMVDTYRLGRVFFPGEAIDRDFPDLGRFATASSRRLSHLEPC